MTGNFYPTNIKGIVLNTREPNYTCKIIKDCQYKLMCLSDNSLDGDFEEHKQQLNEAFDKVFRERCTFER